MYYLLNFNTLTVELKTEDQTKGQKYIDDNDLDLGVALIDSEDELVLQFTLDELTGLADNMCDKTESKKQDFDNEEDAAKFCWEWLEFEQDSIPNLTKGKAPSKNKDAKNPVKRSTGKRMQLDYNDEVQVLEAKAKSGSILDTIVRAIDEEMCSTVGEVVEFITENHIIPKTGELADVKFAEHNIKYFIKQGKISVEEGL